MVGLNGPFPKLHFYVNGGYLSKWAYIKIVFIYYLLVGSIYI